MQPKDSVRWDRCCSVRNRRAWSGRIIHLVSNPRAVAAPAEAECLTVGGATCSTVRAAAVWSRAASIGSDPQMVESSSVHLPIAQTVGAPPVFPRKYFRGDRSPVPVDRRTRAVTRWVIEWHVKSSLQMEVLGCGY